ncbi:MAG: hypothetical protein VW397_04850 [Candidatus Margulisiibacteriota bacterium]
MRLFSFGHHFSKLMRPSLSPQKPYDETHHSNGIFVRNYGKKIVGFGSRHMHHSNAPDRIASIQASVDQELQKLMDGAMVLLEGESNLDTRQDIPIERLRGMDRVKNSSEMVYAFLKVCELKKAGKDVNAIYVEPTFSDQIDFLMDRHVPAELIFSFLIIRNIPQVLHDMGKDSDVSMDLKMSSIQTVNDFIEASLKTIQVKGGALTPADSFQLSNLLKNINRSKNSAAFLAIIQENGHQKSDETLIRIAFDVAKSNNPALKLESIIKNSAEANELTAPINEFNLKDPKLLQLQRQLGTRSMNQDPTPRYRQQTVDLLSDLEDQARPILDRMHSRFSQFDAASAAFLGRYRITKFNFISSMLNICREQAVKDKLSEFSDRQVMVLFGSGHIRSLHSYFLNHS